MVKASTSAVVKASKRTSGLLLQPTLAMGAGLMSSLLVVWVQSSASPRIPCGWTARSSTACCLEGRGKSSFGCPGPYTSTGSECLLGPLSQLLVSHGGPCHLALLRACAELATSRTSGITPLVPWW